MFLFRHISPADRPIVDFCRVNFGFTPRKLELYRIALTHKSKSTEDHGHRVNNERLEYLGDAVLSTIIAEYLYRRYPYQGEGFLTEMRSKIVSRASLNKLAKEIGLTDLVDYNRMQQGVFKSLGGDTFEALMGAIYLEHGYRFTKRLILHHVVEQHMDIDAIEHTGWNYKGKIIDWGQKNGKKISFETVRVIHNGKHQSKQYECRVLINGKPGESGIDTTIKAAEQLAAEKTYKKFVEALVPEK